MRKIFYAIALSVFLLANNSWAWEQPKLPVGLDQFTFDRATPLTCGVLQTFHFWVSERSELWTVKFLNRGRFPNPFRVYRETRQDAEYWVDTNYDGNFNEHFTSFAALIEKYPSFCDAVK